MALFKRGRSEKAAAPTQIEKRGEIADVEGDVAGTVGAVLRGPAAGIGAGQQGADDARNLQKRRLTSGGATAQLPSGAPRTGTTARGGLRIGGS